MVFTTMNYLCQSSLKCCLWSVNSVKDSPQVWQVLDPNSSPSSVVAAFSFLEFTCSSGWSVRVSSKGLKLSKTTLTSFSFNKDKGFLFLPVFWPPLPDILALCMNLRKRWTELAWRKVDNGEVEVHEVEDVGSSGGSCQATCRCRKMT